MLEGLSLGCTNSFQTLWLTDAVTSRQDVPGVRALGAVCRSFWLRTCWLCSLTFPAMITSNTNSEQLWDARHSLSVLWTRDSLIFTTTPWSRWLSALLSRWVAKAEPKGQKLNPDRSGINARCTCQILESHSRATLICSLQMLVSVNSHHVRNYSSFLRVAKTFEPSLPFLRGPGHWVPWLATLLVTTYHRMIRGWGWWGQSTMVPSHPVGVSLPHDLPVCRGWHGPSATPSPIAQGVLCFQVFMRVMTSVPS